MPIAVRLDAPPRNLDEFIAEIAGGVRDVYGDAAASAYEERAPRGFGVALSVPQTCLWAVHDAQRCVALLLGILRGGIGEITLVHVLKGHANRLYEHQLVRAAAENFRREGAQAILCEAMAHAPMDLDGAFGDAGFDAIRRGLFMADAVDAQRAAQGCAPGSALQLCEFRSAADCIAAAYVAHPGRMLHPEVRGADTAHAYLLRAYSGFYGPVLPSYARVIVDRDRCSAVLLGCEIAPGTGFVLQVATRPECQRMGHAQGLLGGFATACIDAGVPRLGLGVTLDNPARHLYEKLGFQLQRPVTAYTWWRDGT